MKSDKKDNMSVNTVSQNIENRKDENTFNLSAYGCLFLMGSSIE